MAEQEPPRRGAREVLDDLADLERRLDRGEVPPAMRDAAVQARHAMVITLNSLLPRPDDGLGGMTTHPDAQVGLPLGTANSPWDDHDPRLMAAYIESKFGPDAAQGFRQTLQENAAEAAAPAARPEDFSGVSVEQARTLFGIEGPKPKAAAPAAPARPAPAAPSAAAAADAAARAAAAGAPKPK